MHLALRRRAPGREAATREPVATPARCPAAVRPQPHWNAPCDTDPRGITMGLQYDQPLDSRDAGCVQAQLLHPCLPAHQHVPERVNMCGGGPAGGWRATCWAAAAWQKSFHMDAMSQIFWPGPCLAHNQGGNATIAMHWCSLATLDQQLPAGGGAAFPPTRRPVLRLAFILRVAYRMGPCMGSAVNEDR